MDTLDDKQLIRSIARGDRHAFAFLYEHYSSMVYNVALSYTKKPQEAEEVTQDVFLKIHKNASKFKGESAVNTWIYRITVNTSLNYLKKLIRLSLQQNTFTSPQTVDFEHPGVVLENQEDAKILYSVIDILPDSQKTAFILSFIEDLPRQEVADIMQTTLKAVESLLQRAKKNMRVELEKLYPNRRKSKK